jgi:hypothetical protein
MMLFEHILKNIVTDKTNPDINANRIPLKNIFLSTDLEVTIIISNARKLSRRALTTRLA